MGAAHRRTAANTPMLATIAMKRPVEVILRRRRQGRLLTLDGSAGQAPVEQSRCDSRTEDRLLRRKPDPELPAAMLASPYDCLRSELRLIDPAKGTRASRHAAARDFELR